MKPKILTGSKAKLIIDGREFPLVSASYDIEKIVKEEIPLKTILKI